MHPLTSNLFHQRPLLGAMTDIDDTLTTDGAITSDALEALGKLKAAGLHVVAITGRPVGWSEPFAGSWPVDAIVAENGAVALQSLPGQGLVKRYQQDETTRQRNYARMQEVLAQIERVIRTRSRRPGAPPPSFPAGVCRHRPHAFRVRAQLLMTVSLTWCFVSMHRERAGRVEYKRERRGERSDARRGQMARAR